MKVETHWPLTQESAAQAEGAPPPSGAQSPEVMQFAGPQVAGAPLVTEKQQVLWTQETCWQCANGMHSLARLQFLMNGGGPR